MSHHPRLALRADLPSIETALSLAFVEDPMITWLMDEPDPVTRRRAAIDGFFSISAASGLQRGHTYVVDGPDRLAAVALWSPPDVRPLSDDEAAALGGAVIAVAGDPALERLMALGEVVARHHPDDRPHFYLFLLGAAEQGCGAGSRALQPALERCDLDGLPAYLESSSARNLSFYERHGFRVVWEEAPLGGPVMRGMWREPGSGRG